MKFPPEAYLIGAQKAGTTSLASLLGQHPAIAVSTPKEPHFFTEHFERGMDWYAERFAADAGALLLDASTSYSAAPVTGDSASALWVSSRLKDVPARIYAVRPDAKFIYILRDPVERTYSAYWHAVRAGDETRPFEDVLDEDSMYIRCSLYYRQITHYLQHFDLKAFLFLDFNELKRDMPLVARKCASFLGVQPAGYPFHLQSVKNKSFQYNVLGSQMQRLAGGPRAMAATAKFVSSFVPDGLRSRLKRLLTKDIPPISPEQKVRLREYFRRDAEQLYEITKFPVLSKGS